MTRLTDGMRTIEITMATWNGNGWSPDWSCDFFEVGGLEFDEKASAYKVRDIAYCIDQANDWKFGRGDYCDERLDLEDMGMGFDPDDRLVVADILTV